MSGQVVEADPFDLPDWLGEGEVTWSAVSGLRTGHQVQGWLTDPNGTRLACDLLAVDEAYPAPVADDRTRIKTYQAWRHGQVHLLRIDARLTLAMPGSGFDADRVMDAIGRLAKAVGASAERYTVLLRIGC